MALFSANGIQMLSAMICGKYIYIYIHYVQLVVSGLTVCSFTYSESWQDIWHEIEPLIYAVGNEGESVFLSQARYWMTRFGWMEETYFTYQVRTSYRLTFDLYEKWRREEKDENKRLRWINIISVLSNT